MVLIGILAVAAVVLLAAVLLFKPKSTAPGSEPSPDATGGTPAPAETAPTTHAAGTQPEHAAPAQQVSATATQAPATGNAGHGTTDAQASVQDLIKKLKDASLPMSERKAAIRALAKLGTPEALAALKEALTGGSDEIRAAIAEGLGECTSPECGTMLVGLLKDPSEAVVQAAIRGLAQLGSPEATAALTQLLNDSQRSVDIRSEAIAGLGNIEGNGAFEALCQAAMTIGDEDIVSEVLDALGGRDFSETQSFFDKYMGSAVSSDLRVTAIESLWQAKGDPTAFLVKYLSDSDAEVRNSAAWAMSATDATGKHGQQLLASLQGEQDEGVRVRLYQALGNQDSFDTGTVLALLQQEKGSSARVAGMDLLAKTLRDDPSPTLETFFEQTAAPELQKMALTSEMKDDRMAAVIALIRANTPGAVSALQQLAQSATEPRVKQAASKFIANPPPVIPKPGR